MLAMAAFACALAGYGWVKGADHVQSSWDEANSRAMVRVAQVRQKQSETTTTVVTHYVDREKVVRETGDTIIKEVIKYVPSNSCSMLGGFRVLHDAAATNTIPNASGVADAQPVTAQDVAATVATNYKQCHEVEVQLDSLQEWVRRQSTIDLSGK
jgi:hypothetical protein